MAHDKVPQQHRYENESGMVTNACPYAPNGMEFSKPEVEQYFDIEYRRTHESELISPVEERNSDPDRWMREYELCRRVEENRFMHKPVTGNPKE